MRDRGQSELIGFAIIFGLILFSVSVLSVTGYVGLQNAQEYERTDNAQRAFTALADNIDDIIHHGASSRTTEIKLADAKLSLEERETVTVSGSGPEGDFTHTYAVRSIVYDSGTGTEIAYSNGALVRQDGESAVMFREPNLVLTEDAAVVPIVQPAPDGTEAVGGSTTVLLETKHADTELLGANEGEYELTIVVESPHAEAWERYLDAESATDCSRNENTVTCGLTTSRVYVTVERIAVTFG